MLEINDFKKKYLKELASTPTFSNAWKVLEPIIRSKLSHNPTGAEVLDLGDKLSDIFQSNLEILEMSNAQTLI